MWHSLDAEAFAVGQQASSSSIVNSRGYLWGAGMALRPELLRFLYTNNVNPILTGRLKSQLTAGDDSEICKWYLYCGFNLFTTIIFPFSTLFPFLELATRIINLFSKGLEIHALHFLRTTHISRSVNIHFLTVYFSCYAILVFLYY